MFIRVITSLIAFLIFLPFLIFSDTVMFPFAMSLLGTIACFEMMKCIGMIKKYAVSVPSLLMTLIMPYVMRYVASPLELFALILSLYLLYEFAVTVFMTKSISPQDAAMAMMTTIYIAISFSAMVIIRDMTDGQYMFIVIFLGAWMTDTFAYFSGKLFGKHKLIPQVSPKKTIEGSIGGSICSIIIVVLYGFVFSLFTDFAPNYILLGICGAASAVASQIGDLIMSVIKRKYEIKDYGKIFPGHGGVLDRFDSVISNAVVLLAVLKIAELIK